MQMGDRPRPLIWRLVRPGYANVMFGVPAVSLVFLLMIALVTIGGLCNERVPAKRVPGPTRGDPKAEPSQDIGDDSVPDAPSRPTDAPAPDGPLNQGCTRLRGWRRRGAARLGVGALPVSTGSAVDPTFPRPQRSRCGGTLLRVVSQFQRRVRPAGFWQRNRLQIIREVPHYEQRLVA